MDSVVAACEGSGGRDERGRAPRVATQHTDGTEDEQAPVQGPAGASLLDAGLPRPRPAGAWRYAGLACLVAVSYASWLFLLEQL